MRTPLIISAFIFICAIESDAADPNIYPQGAGKNIEQKRTEILQHIQERVTNSQAEITCVKTAASHEEFRACHEKYRPAPPKNDKRNQSPQQEH
ncbi:MAG: hypothetical protein WCI45_01715 [Desulfuromonadales bacterium]